LRTRTPKGSASCSVFSVSAGYRRHVDEEELLHAFRSVFDREIPAAHVVRLARSSTPEL